MANESAGERLTVPLFSNRQALIQRLYDAFAADGFDYQSAAEMPVHACMWTRPPFFTDLVLDDEPMQNYLNVPMRFAPDEFADIYERFIAGYLYSKRLHDTPSDVWLRRQLKLQHYTARSIFTRPQEGKQRLGLHHNLVEFAAAVAYNHRVTVERAHNAFVVTTPKQGFSFGVRNGLLVSKWGKSRERHDIRCRGLTHFYSLDKMQRGAMERTKEPTLLDALKTWAAANSAARLGNRGFAMHLGVEILWWRAPLGEVPGQLRLLTNYEYSKDALVAACTNARQFETFDRPLETLKEIFVPFVKSAEFDQLFGSNRVSAPIPNWVRQRWDRAINTLDPKYSDEVQETNGENKNEKSV